MNIFRSQEQENKDTNNTQEKETEKEKKEEKENNNNQEKENENQEDVYVCCGKSSCKGHAVEDDDDKVVGTCGYDGDGCCGCGDNDCPKYLYDNFL